MDFDTFLKWEKTTRDTIDLKKIYIDITGDLASGVLLSQLVYYYLPDKSGKKDKLRVIKEGKSWVAKRREDWWDECRLKPKQVDRILKDLKEAGLIEVKIFKFNGVPTTHIRLIKEAFMQRLNDLIQNSRRENGNSSKGKFPKEEDGNSSKGKMEIPQKGISNNIDYSHRLHTENNNSKTSYTYRGLNTSTFPQNVENSKDKSIQPLATIVKSVKRRLGVNNTEQNAPPNINITKDKDIVIDDPPEVKKSLEDLRKKIARDKIAILKDYSKNLKWIQSKRLASGFDPKDVAKLITVCDWCKEAVEKIPNIFAIDFTYWIQKKRNKKYDNPIRVAGKIAGKFILSDAQREGYVPFVTARAEINRRVGVSIGQRYDRLTSFLWDKYKKLPEDVWEITPKEDRQQYEDKAKLLQEHFSLSRDTSHKYAILKLWTERKQEIKKELESVKV